MSNVRYRLLTLSICTALLHGCAGASIARSNLRSSNSDGEQLVLDFEQWTATTPNWTSPVADCSDENYNCVSVPDRMVLIFPRDCATALRPRAPLTRFGEFLGVAPAPHLSAPSGSYVLKSFATTLLFYDARVGLTEVRITKNSPFDREFDPNDYLSRYRLKTAQGRPIFICSQ